MNQPNEEPSQLDDTARIAPGPEADVVLDGSAGDLAAADAPPVAKWRGRLLILLAVVMWSSSGLFVKSGFFDDWPTVSRGPLLAFWRSFFAALVLLPVVRRPRWEVRLVPLAIIFAVMCLVYMTALVLTSAASAIWLQATAPWWVFLFSLLLLREGVNRRDLFTLIPAAVGVAIILGHELVGQAWVGMLAGLASGATFGGVLMLMRKLSGHDGAWLVALCHGSAAVALLPWMLVIGIYPSPWQLVVLAGFGAIQMGIPYVFLVRGLRTVPSQEAALIALAEPVLMPLWVFLVGQETPSWWIVVGAGCIFTGLVLRYVWVERMVARRSSR